MTNFNLSKLITNEVFKTFPFERQEKRREFVKYPVRIWLSPFSFIIEGEGVGASTLPIVFSPSPILTPNYTHFFRHVQESHDHRNFSFSHLKHSVLLDAKFVDLSHSIKLQFYNALLPSIDHILFSVVRVHLTLWLINFQ